MSKFLIILLITLIVIFIGSMIFQYISEKKKYNKGICKKCGGKLRHFDNDSQSGIGLCCDTCNEYFWISWFRDIKEGDDINGK